MSYQEKQNENKIVSLMVLAIVFAYLFLVAQYESWTIPVPIMMTVATPILGALAGLLITGESFSIYAQLGMVMLVGLTAKNAILMVEFSKQEREMGVPIYNAKVVQQMQNVVSAEKNLILAEIDAVYKLRQAFFGLKRCIELNIVAEQAVAQYKEHLDHMLAKYKYGKSTKYDCSKARVDYDSSVLEQITTSNNVRIAKANLINALGFDKDVDFSIGDGIMKDTDMTVEELMELVRKYDPSLGALYASAKGASSYIDEQIANLYPTISLNAEAVATGVSSGWPAIWNIAGGAELVQNIFNGNRDMNAIEQAVSELRSARSQISEYEQKAYAELTTAHLNLEKSKKQYEVALAAEKVAKENLDLVTERFNVGKASALERTDAQVSYTSAQADAVSAKYDWQDALATIAYLTGGDVKSEN